MGMRSPVFGPRRSERGQEADLWGRAAVSAPKPAPPKPALPPQVKRFPGQRLPGRQKHTAAPKARLIGLAVMDRAVFQGGDQEQAGAF